MTHRREPASASVPKLTGHLINGGEYQLMRKLGSGAYGVVYSACCIITPSLDRSARDYAVKVMAKSAMTSRIRHLVRREVALHRLMSSHPGVVSVLDTFEDHNYVYIIMENCLGGDLFGKICEEKVYFKNDKLVKSHFVQMLDAVHACHRRSIFHRDLKPENFLVSKDGSKVYLTDFGLSSTNQVSETFGCGSSAYMSPECIGKETAHRPFSNRSSDVWSLGIILLNMVTNRSPWQKAVSMDDCFREFLLNENYLRDLLPVSREAQHLFRRIFTLIPSQRITLAELRKEILAMDTFFMSDADIAIAGSPVRVAVSHCGYHIDAAAFDAPPPSPLTEVKPPLCIDQLSPREHAPDSPVPTRLHTSDAFVIGSLSSAEVGWASDETTTASESDGPATPSTHAQDPEIELPEFDIKLDDDEPAKVGEVQTKDPLCVTFDGLGITIPV